MNENKLYKIDQLIKIKNKIKTSGCANGTIFGDVIDIFDRIKLKKEVFRKLKLT